MLRTLYAIHLFLCLFFSSVFPPKIFVSRKMSPIWDKNPSPKWVYFDVPKCVLFINSKAAIKPSSSPLKYFWIKLPLPLNTPFKKFLMRVNFFNSNFEIKKSKFNLLNKFKKSYIKKKKLLTFMLTFQWHFVTFPKSLKPLKDLCFIKLVWLCQLNSLLCWV